MIEKKMNNTKVKIRVQKGQLYSTIAQLNAF